MLVIDMQLLLSLVKDPITNICSPTTLLSVSLNNLSTKDLYGTEVGAFFY